MGKTSGGLRKGGGLGSDGGGNFKGTIGKTESISSIKDKFLRRSVQQAISKYESRMGVRQQNVKVASISNAAVLGVHTTVNGQSAQIALNSKIFKNGNMTAVSAVVKNSYKSGFLTKTNKPVQHAIVHEMAHATWNSHLKGKNAIAASKFIRDKYKIFMDERSKGKAATYGKYAEANVNEFWAEVSTRAVLGKSDKYTRFVKSTIKKFKL